MDRANGEPDRLLEAKRGDKFFFAVRRTAGFFYKSAAFRSHGSGLPATHPVQDQASRAKPRGISSNIPWRRSGARFGIERRRLRFHGRAVNRNWPIRACILPTE